MPQRHFEKCHQSISLVPPGPLFEAEISSMLLFLLKVWSQRFGLEILFGSENLCQQLSLRWGWSEGQTQGKPYLFAYLDHLDFFFLTRKIIGLLKP